MSKQEPPKQLREFSGTDSLLRSVFETDYQGHHYAIDVDYWNETVTLYVDGKERDEQGSPAEFEVGDDARIVAEIGMYGLEYAHLVDDAGEHALTAAAGTVEAWRATLDRDRPGFSRAIAMTSWTILAIAAATQLTDLLELLLHLIGIDAELPQILELPNSVSIGIIIAAIIAGIERGMRLKSGSFM